MYNKHIYINTKTECSQRVAYKYKTKKKTHRDGKKILRKRLIRACRHIRTHSILTLTHTHAYTYTSVNWQSMKCREKRNAATKTKRKKNKIGGKEVKKRQPVLSRRKIRRTPRRRILYYYQCVSLSAARNPPRINSLAGERVRARAREMGVTPESTPHGTAPHRGDERERPTRATIRYHRRYRRRRGSTERPSTPPSHHRSITSNVARTAHHYTTSLSPHVTISNSYKSS